MSESNGAKTKVLIISPGYYPITKNRGGAIEELINIYLEHNANSNKYKITVYSASTNKLGGDSNVYANTEFRNIKVNTSVYKLKTKIHAFARKLNKDSYRRPFSKLVVKDLQKRNEIHKYDIVIIENSVSEVLFFRENIQPKSALVLHLHNDYLNKDVLNSRKIIQALDEVWSVSNFISDRVNEIDPKRKISKTLYNTTPHYSEIKKNKKEKKAHKSFKIIYVGRIMKEKGVAELVDAFNKLQKDYKDTELTILGGSRNLYGKDAYISKIKRIASENSHINVVGNLDAGTLSTHYRQADIQVVPSVCNEAFGLTALEGLLYGVPVIFTNRGGLPEIFCDKTLSIDQPSSQEIYKMLKTAYMHRGLIEKVANNNKKMGNSFTPKKYCSSFDNLIKKLTEKE